LDIDKPITDYESYQAFLQSMTEQIPDIAPED
jgi:hypothetical protein